MDDKKTAILFHVSAVVHRSGIFEVSLNEVCGELDEMKKTVEDLLRDKYEQVIDGQMYAPSGLIKLLFI